MAIVKAPVVRTPVAPPPPMPPAKAPPAQSIQARVMAPTPPSIAAAPPAPPVVQAPDKVTLELQGKLASLQSALSEALAKQKEMAEQLKKLSVVPDFVPEVELLYPEGSALPVRQDDWRLHYHGKTGSLHMWEAV